MKHIGSKPTFSVIDGFTLVELLIVISIIALLSTIVLVSVSTARARGRDAQREGTVRSIANALELYRNDHGHYPCNNGIDSTNSNFMQILVSDKYLPSIPRDPINSGIYEYYYMTFASQRHGACGQIYELDYNRENEIPGKTCALGGYDTTYDSSSRQVNTLGHCHILSQPLPSQCVNSFDQGGINTHNPSDPMDANCPATDYGDGFYVCCSNLKDPVWDNEW